MLLPGKFASQVEALESAPHCGIAYGTTRYVSVDGEVRSPWKRTGEDSNEGLIELDILAPEAHLAGVTPSKNSPSHTSPTRWRITSAHRALGH